MAPALRAPPHVPLHRRVPRAARRPDRGRRARRGAGAGHVVARRRRRRARPDADPQARRRARGHAHVLALRGARRPARRGSRPRPTSPGCCTAWAWTTPSSRARRSSRCIARSTSRSRECDAGPRPCVGHGAGSRPGAARCAHRHTAGRRARAAAALAVPAALTPDTVRAIAPHAGNAAISRMLVAREPAAGHRAVGAGPRRRAAARPRAAGRDPARAAEGAGADRREPLEPSDQVDRQAVLRARSRSARCRARSAGR